MPWRDAPIVQPAQPAQMGPTRAAAQAWESAPIVQHADEFADLWVPGTPFNPQPAPSLVDQIMGAGDYAYDTMQIGREGAVEGAIGVLGLLPEAINAAPMLANFLPGVEGVGPISEKPIMGWENLQDAARLLQIYDRAPKPQDAFQRAVGRVGEELGATAVPVGGTIGAATRRGVDSIRRSSSPIARMFMEPAAIDPWGFARMEAAFASGAGLGASAANEFARTATGSDEINPWVDMGGAVGGAAATGIGRGGFGMARDLAAGFTGNPNYAGQVVQENVADALIKNSDIVNQQINPLRQDTPLDTTPLVDAIMRPSQAENLVPGFTATTADRAGDTGLAAMEAARSRANPGPYRAQAGGNAQAVDQQFMRMAPDMPASEFRGALDTGRETALGTARTAVLDADDNLAQATADLIPVLTATGRGQQIRNALQDASDAAKEILGQAWRPIDEARDIVDTSPLAASFRQARAQTPDALQDMLPRASSVPARWAGEATPPAPTGLLDARGNPIMTEAIPADARQPLEQVMGVRTALTNALREDGVTPQEVRLIEDHITRLDNYLDANMPPALREQYDAAKAATVDYNDRFTRPQTAIAQTLQERQGMPSADASTIPGRFVQDDQGRIADFEALMREAGSDERVQLAVRDQILHDVRERGLIDRPAQLEQYLDQYGTVFNRFPEMREQLGNVANLRRSLDDAIAFETNLTETLNRQGKSAVANYLTFGDERARDAMNGVIRSRDPAASIDELLTFVGDDPKAVEGARSAFWEVMENASRSRNINAEIGGVTPIVPRRLLNFLDDPATAAVAERLYRDNPEHLANLRELGEALLTVNTGPRVGNAINPSGTALMQRGDPAVTLAEAGSKLYQVNIGRASPLYVGAYLAGKLARRSVGKQQAGAFDRLVDKALLEPEVAATLLRENNPANRAALARNLHIWLGNEAATLVDALNEDDDEMNEAIMRGLN